MVVLHYDSGARDFEVLGPMLDSEEWARLKAAAIELLRARGQETAGDLLGSTPFELGAGTNVFGDDFSVLVATVPLEDYVKLAELKSNESARAAIHGIVNVLNEIGPYVRFVAVRLDSKAPPALVPSPSPRLNSAAVERALRDAELLLQSSGAVSAVDRAHTALHGYLRALCDEVGIDYASDAGMTDLFKRLREQHGGFGVGPHVEYADRIARSLSSAVDAVNTLRNRASIAHPNEELLADPEAILVINCVRTLLHYVGAKTAKRL